MSDPTPDLLAALQKSLDQAKAKRRYRETHSAEGYPLGSPEYPDNREGRRRLARSWKRVSE